MSSPRATVLPRSKKLPLQSTTIDSSTKQLQESLLQSLESISSPIDPCCHTSTKLLMSKLKDTQPAANPRKRATSTQTTGAIASVHSRVEQRGSNIKYYSIILSEEGTIFASISLPCRRLAFMTMMTTNYKSY